MHYHNDNECVSILKLSKIQSNIIKTVFCFNDKIRIYKLHGVFNEY